MRLLVGLAAVAVAASLGGCADVSRPAVDGVVTSFYGAYGDGEGRTACDLLAPATREEVETSAQAPCAEAVVDEELPNPGPVGQSSIYGDQGQVRLDGDTVFVAEFPGGWKVVAAGCTRQPSGPYDCKLEAG
jgi:hypothetical protein